MNIMNGIDTYIAIGLIGIIIIVFLIHKMGVLPKKSLPFIVGGLLAVFGLHILRETRTNKHREKFKKLEDELKRKGKELEKVKEELAISDKELHDVIAEENKIRAAHQKTILINNEKARIAKEELKTKTTFEIFDMYREKFGD